MAVLFSLVATILTSCIIIKKRTGSNEAEVLMAGSEVQGFVNSVDIQDSLTADNVAKSTSSPSIRTKTKTLQLPNFNSLSIKGPIEVEYIYSKTDKNIVFECDSKIMSDLSVRVKEGELKLNLVKFWNRNNSKGCLVKAIVTGPYISEVELESCSTFQTKEIKSRCFSIDASGASRINIDNIEAKELEIELSGASLCHLQGIKTKKFEIDLSGAAKVDCLETVADYLELELSGASSVKIASQYIKKINVEASGASIVEISGNCGTLEKSLSGVSKLKIPTLKTNIFK